MNNSVLPQVKDRGRPLWRSCAGKGRAKYSSDQKARNPLKNLDYDERIKEIQGNPIAESLAFRAKRSRTKKTQIDRMGPARRREAKIHNILVKSSAQGARVQSNDWQMSPPSTQPAVTSWSPESLSFAV